MTFLLFKALVRDGFRCVISGQYDVTSVERSKELELELERNVDATAGVCFAECAHIFPESTNLNAKISGTTSTSNNASAADKVYSFPIYLDVFLFIHHHLDVAS
jgi:hypothetical protein